MEAFTHGMLEYINVNRDFQMNFLDGVLTLFAELKWSRELFHLLSMLAAIQIPPGLTRVCLDFIKQYNYVIALEVIEVMDLI